MTKRIAISELEGAALDWAVAKAVGCAPYIYQHDPGPVLVGVNEYPPGFDADPFHGAGRGGPFRPREWWRQCGQLLDDYDVEFAKTHDGVVVAMADKGGMCGTAEGPNRRVAACRAIVASHNPSGYVEVPDELVEGE